MTRDPSMGGRMLTLATAPLDGSTAREILNGVSDADWSGDGSALAVILDLGRRIEFPVGKVLAETSGSFQDVRIAPSGKMLAFIEHPVPKDDRGFVGMIDAMGKKTVLTGEWASVQGLAWSSDGREIWFTASEKAAARALRAVTPEGSQRIIMQTPGSQHLLDIHDGKVLLASENWRFEILGSFPGESLERNLSWFDLSIVNDIAADGRTIAFHEDGDGGGPDYSTYLRHIDVLAPVRLGPGGRSVLSPDGRFALSITPSLPEKLMLLPTGAGEARTLPSGGITIYNNAGWTPDGRRVVFEAIEPKHGSRIYLQDLDGGLPQPITDEGVGVGSQAVVDVKSVLGRGPDRTWSRYSLNGGKPEGVPALKPMDDPTAIRSNRNDGLCRRKVSTSDPDLPFGHQQWQARVVEGDCAERSRWSRSRLYAPDHAGRQILRLFVPTPAVGSLSYRRPAVTKDQLKKHKPWDGFRGNAGSLLGSAIIPA
jgi:hypothetical protein